MIRGVVDAGRNVLDLALGKLRGTPTDHLTIRVFGGSRAGGLFIRLPRSCFPSFAEFLKDPGDDLYLFGDGQTSSAVEKEANGLALSVWRTGSDRKRSVWLDLDRRVEFCEGVLHMMEEETQ